MRGKDLLEKMSLADDKYIEEASGYKKNRHIKVLKTALIAAAVLAVLLPVIFIVAAKTNGTFSSPGHINSSAGDWPYYNTKRELENAATSIYDGVITDIFFKVIDMKTGEVVTSEPEEYSSSYRLHTVYEVKVTHNYKNADSEKKYFCITGGKKGYKEDEQAELLKSLNLYNEESGIVIYGFDIPDLCIGKEYKFYTVHRAGPYDYIVNPTQFAVEK